MLKNILTLFIILPRHVIGYICIVLSMALAYLARGLSLFGAVCLDLEGWWARSDKLMKDALDEYERRVEEL